jgi:hypothetical protein
MTRTAHRWPTAEVDSRRAVIVTTLLEGDGMPKLVVTHSVVDVEKWLQGKSERADAIAAMGGSNVIDHVAHDGSNTVAISADVEDVERVIATLASPPADVAAAMESHGVLPPVTVYVAK